MITPELAAAYAATDFCIDDDGEQFVLKVGQFSADLQRLFNQHQVGSAAFITAHNPASQKLTNAENQQRQSRLEATVAEHWAYLKGYGVDSAGAWEPETSLLVLGVSQQEAVDLGARYGQYAVVCIDENIEPRLCFCE